MRLVAAALWAAVIARAAAQPAGYFFVGVTSSVMMQRDERRPWRPGLSGESPQSGEYVMTN